MTNIFFFCYVCTTRTNLPRSPTISVTARFEPWSLKWKKGASPLSQQWVGEHDQQLRVSNGELKIMKNSDSNSLGQISLQWWKYFAFLLHSYYCWMLKGLKPPTASTFLRKQIILFEPWWFTNSLKHISQLNCNLNLSSGRVLSAVSHINKIKICSIMWVSTFWNQLRKYSRNHKFIV